MESLRVWRCSPSSSEWRQTPDNNAQTRSYKGIVVPGRGFAVLSMSNESLLLAIRKLVGIDIIPGTLNLRLSEPFNPPLENYVTEEELGGSVWRDHAPSRRGVRYGDVRIAGRFQGIVFQGDEPDYSRFQAEIMSNQMLRENLSLKDGDTLQFDVIIKEKVSRI